MATGCGDAEKEANQENKTEMKAQEIKDPHSFARPGEAVVKHLDLDIAVDFEQEKISGVAGWTIETSDDAKQLVLDTRGLDVSKVTLGEDGAEETKFSFGAEVEFLGNPLYIDITPETKIVNVHFATRPGADALQWLKPVQTAGKEHPFLFTQSQAILARTWLPCQDGPGIRFTYDAKVKVDPSLMAVMSASNPTEKSADGTYEFKMEQPIPAYLMALSVGDIEFKPVGERTGVYAEPSVVDAAHYEFEDMEKMLIAAEELYGKYAWDRYDVIVLPPSFPFGGMENPRLTFATPTILAGDKSLTSLVAHELAHSWSGNLVTNANWNDFWLNEGFTVYFERRIMESLYGESYNDMLSVLGYQDLQGTLEDLADSPKDSHLKLDLEGRDPDDGMNDIAYEKGCLFLEHIESLVGREEFDTFLKNYFDTNAFQVMTTEGFIEYLKANLVKGDEELLKNINLEGWIFSPGLPEGVPAPTSERFAQVDKALEFFTGSGSEAVATDDWTTHEWLHFIRHIPADISNEKMAELDQKFGFTNSGNSEIQAAWFMHTIRHNYAAADAALEAFLIRVGRRKFLKPLYKALAETPEGLEKGRAIYAKAKENYHSVSVGTLNDVLGLSEE